MTGEVEQWESAITCEGRVVVLEETTSTQDAAIDLKLQAGDVFLVSHTSQLVSCTASTNFAVCVEIPLAYPKIFRMTRSALRTEPKLPSIVAINPST